MATTRRILLSFFLPLALIALNACREEGPHLLDKLPYSANLEANTVPVVAQTGASGVAALEYTRSTGELAFNLSLRGISPTRVVIAYGDPNPWDNGPEIVDITSQVSESGGTGSIILTDYAEKGKLLNDRCYFRVDTEAYPYGELRGQIRLVRED